MCEFLHKALRRGGICLLVLGVAWSNAQAFHSHKGYFPNGYSGAANCLLCHKDAADEVMASVHYLWRTPNPLVEFPGGGSHGMIDRACGLVGSNSIVNYYEECGQCHVGDSLPFPDPQTGEYTFDQKMNLDCLICHAADGMYDMNGDGKAEPGELANDRPLVYDSTRGRYMWHQDRSVRAAESVGGPVTTEACLRCHHHGLEDYHYKRGTPYEPDTDVHAAAGMTCTDCHTVENHKIARGSRITDIFAWELQDVDVRCDQCHGLSPHPNNPTLNAHTAKIGCETCHIPEVMGAQRRIWVSTYGVTQGPEANIPDFNTTTGLWEPYSKYDSGLVSPSYRWFTGAASMLAEPIATPGAFNMQPATRDTPGAKILPFRNLISGQPMDAFGLPGTPNFDPQFTMEGALEKMAPALKALGMMRPEGLTPAEKAVMSQFPNMLYFDREDYFKTGDVSDAISIGMAKMAAAFMGMDVSKMPRDQLISMGSAMWSGQYAGLDLPDTPYAPNYVNDQDPTTASGSFITVSHAVKKDGALSCNQCHVPNGRLNFAQLGYTPAQVAYLTSLSTQPGTTLWMVY